MNEIQKIEYRIQELENKSWLPDDPLREYAKGYLDALHDVLYLFTRPVENGN